ncbi:MAG: SGNH/GDSL hydrolase family protein [Sedimentisphaerales bacterium]|nr:SGNH/GDSL hydrolase family protein [Sedimentisphaerales bacterium]
MRVFKKLSIAIVILSLCASCSSIQSQETSAKKGWIAAWASSQQLTERNNNPPATLTNSTLRQTVYVTLGGSKMRIQFSNKYGNSPVEIKAANVAKSKGTGSSEIDTSTDKALSFNGSPSVTIPTGEEVYSDPLDFEVEALSTLAVSIYFGETSPNVTGHPGSRTTSYIKEGNLVSAASIESAATTEHWYNLSMIDLWLDDSYACVVTLGDSITDGRGCTTNMDNRWPDFLARRLQANPETAKIGLLNHGVGGNTMTTGGLGVPVSQRFEHDVLDPCGVKWVIVLEGVNDIGNSGGFGGFGGFGRGGNRGGMTRGGNAGGGNVPDKADQVIAVYEQIIEQAHAKGIKIYGSPILPFMGSQYRNEEGRQKINEWIRTSGKFDAVIDMDAAVRDPEDPTRLKAEYDSGDHLHLNPAGFQKMVEAIDLSLFKMTD